VWASVLCGHQCAKSVSISSACVLSRVSSAVLCGHYCAYAYAAVCCCVFVIVCVCGVYPQQHVCHQLRVVSSVLWACVCIRICARRCCVFVIVRIRSVYQQCMWKVLSCFCDMGWLRFVGSFKLSVSFAKYRLFYRALLQKRLILLRSLLIVATSYVYLQCVSGAAATGLCICGVVSAVCCQRSCVGIRVHAYICRFALLCFCDSVYPRCVLVASVWGGFGS